MTKSFEKITVDSLDELNYSGADAKMETAQRSETPVLDLSFKRSSPPPSAPDYFKVPVISPLRESAYLEQQQETNNNDNKHVNSYQHSESSQMSLAHHYQPEEASTFPSNHERKSPFENRSYVMTPPSESDSPKKPRLQAVYEHTNIVSDSRRQPVYPTAMIPVPMSLPISVPSVLPTLLPHGSPVPASVPASIPLMMPPASSPSSHEVSQTTVTAEEAKKAPRPFKAYPKDPLSITLGPDMMFDQELKKAYSDFRNRMLDSVKRTNEGTNIKMRRVSNSPSLPTSTCDEKDAAYWERRRKNNEAAKRSRDARRAKEDEIAIRAAFLEQEYIRLKYENAVLRDENTKIKCMLYGH